MRYLVLRGLLVGLQSIWHTAVSCTKSWFSALSPANVSADSTKNRVDLPPPLDDEPYLVVQDNVPVVDVQPSSVEAGQRTTMPGLLVGIRNRWFAWLFKVSSTLSWLRGETTRRHAIVVPATIDNRHRMVAVNSVPGKSQLPVAFVSRVYHGEN